MSRIKTSTVSAFEVKEGDLVIINHDIEEVISSEVNGVGWKIVVASDTIITNYISSFTKVEVSNVVEAKVKDLKSNDIIKLNGIWWLVAVLKTPEKGSRKHRIELRSLDTAAKPHTVYYGASKMFELLER